MTPNCHTLKKNFKKFQKHFDYNKTKKEKKYDNLGSWTVVGDNSKADFKGNFACKFLNCYALN